MYFDPIPQPHQDPTLTRSQLHVLPLLFLVPFFITQVQCVLSVYSQVWGHPLGLD